MNTSVRLRIVVTIALTATVVLLGAGAIRLRRTYVDLRTKQAQYASAAVEELSTELWVLVHDYNRAQIDRSIEATMRERSIAAILVRDAVDGSVIAGRSRDADWAVVPLDLDADRSRYAHTTADIVQGGSQLGTLEVWSTDRFLHRDLVAASWKLAVETLAVLGVLVVALLLAISRNVVRPIRALRETCRQISAGDLERPIDTSRQDEIGCLAQSFATLRDSVREKINALRDGEELLRATMSSTANGVLAVSDDGRLLVANPSFLEMWDLSEQQLASTKRNVAMLDVARDKLVDPEGFRTRVEDLNHSSSIGLDEIALADGRVLERHSCPLIRDGRPVGRVWSYSDVTQRKREEAARQKLQEDLRQAQKLEAIGQLAGGVAHDFNNLLTAIKGNVELLKMSLPPDCAEPMACATEIETASDRAAELTRQLLAFSRKGKTQTVQVNLHGIIDEVIALLRHSIDKRIQISERLEADPSVVEGDPTQLQSAILNLAVNGRDAMPEGGRLTFTTRNVVLDEDNCRHIADDVKPGPYLELSVADTGAGIAPEVRDRLFEPFFTTKGQGKGTGLGLASVYGSVRNHQGTIRVYSELGHGSVFRVLLPLSAKAAAAAKTPTSKGGPVYGRGHVLVVDDEQPVRQMVQTVLERLGYQATAIGDPEEAVAFVQVHHEDVDLVLLDLIMPKLSGEEVFEHIRQIAPNMPVLVASGFSQEAVTERLIARGASGFLSKPYSIDDLSRELARNLPPSTRLAPTGRRELGVGSRQ